MLNESGQSETRKPSDYFPYRNEDGSAAYWHYQKDVIEKTLDAIKRGKRCIVIDAPVGSGKSVINYTLLKCLGKSVYVTAQKTLQDQIDNEDWPSVKSVKGRSAYTCNYVAKKGVVSSCDVNYDRTGIETCREKTSFQFQIGESKFSSLVSSIESTILQYCDDRAERRSRTSFLNREEISSIIRKYENTFPDPHSMFIKHFSCNMHAVECPVKSARVMAALSDIAVVNPDAYYSLNKTMQLFIDREYMVVDEAHRLDDAVQRMFRIKIPVGLFDDCLGINLKDLAAVSGIENFCQMFKEELTKVIWPTVHAIKIMTRYEDILAVNSMESHNKSSSDDFGDEIAEGARAFAVSGDGFCIMSVMIAAFKGIGMNELIAKDPRYSSFNKLYDSIRLKYDELASGNSIDLDNHFMKKISTYAKKSDPHIVKVGSIEERLDSAQKHSYIASQRKFASLLSVICNQIESVMYVIDGMVRSKFGDNRVFVKELAMAKKIDACQGEYLKFYNNFKYNPEEKETVMDLIPLHIGCLLQNLIFKGMKAVIMTSGTWPAPESMVSGYGFKKSEIEVLKINPIFEAKNRPIYINTIPSWTDFSEKSESNGGFGPIYKYQTPDGASKFCYELSSLIRYIRNTKGINTNIAVHCGNYGISKLIAEYFPYLDESYLLHLPRTEGIFNKTNGFQSTRQTKDVLIHKFCNNPEMGLTIVSPSILEGLDFKGDICRAQIILKAPIPNLTDPYIKYIFNGCPEINLKPNKMFLDIKAAIDLNQMYGRVVRGSDDWGDTYILDLALSKRMARACNVYVEGLNINTPGNMGALDMKYIKQGIRCERDSYGRFLFKWPIKI